ncbi:MAG: hypothetical protein WC516_08565 [Patescibacteria group bacterium]|jgi:uncharacterized membrane protein
MRLLYTSYDPNWFIYPAWLIQWGWLIAIVVVCGLITLAWILGAKGKFGYGLLLELVAGFIGMSCIVIFAFVSFELAVTLTTLSVLSGTFHIIMNHGCI